ncbi:MAG: glycoside hydrolase family 25 protein [Ruminococcus sp.]
MRLNCRRFISALTSLVFLASAVCYSVNAEEEETELISEDDILLTDDNASNAQNENWLSVAAEVLKYYSEYSAGLEPLVTEKNWRFYDVIPDKVISLTDAVYFLDIYSCQGAGIEFGGYIPKRDGSYSPVTTTAITGQTTSEITSTISSSSDIPQTTTAAKTTTTSKASSTTTTAKTTTAKTSSTSKASFTATAKTTTTSKPVTSVTSKTTISQASSDSENTTSATTTTTVTTTVITRPPVASGIDVSVYQGKVDWKTVKESGVEFAIIRAGYGKHINQKDKYFDINMENAKAAGIDCGAYWFSYATTPEDALKEADVFYEVIKDYKFEYPIFFDYETNAQYALEPEESSAIIHAFCDRMESYGYYVSLCSYVNFFNTRIEPEIFDCFDTWIAHYNVQVPSYNRNYGIWQYSCTGKIPGIDADVDLNYAYYNYPNIMIKNNLNGFINGE